MFQVAEKIWTLSDCLWPERSWSTSFGRLENVNLYLNVKPQSFLIIDTNHVTVENISFSFIANVQLSQSSKRIGTSVTGISEKYLFQFYIAFSHLTPVLEEFEQVDW